MMIWRYQEFARIVGVVPAQTREALVKEEVLPYLNENKIQPEDCKIVCFVQNDPFAAAFRTTKVEEPRLVCQVFYVTNG